MAQGEALLWRSPARLIAILGPYDAGKTSLLTSFFLQIANGQHCGFPYKFASSLSLHGFRELCEQVGRWSGRPGEQILTHTSKEDSADRGTFLHIGLRPANAWDDRHIDVLLSDLPGEWITQWGDQLNDDSRRRLRFVGRCDGFMVLLSVGDLLSVETAADADANAAALIRRVIAVVGTSTLRPRAITLLYSKFDLIADTVVPPEDNGKDKRESWGIAGARSPRTWKSLEEARRAGFAVTTYAVAAFPRGLSEGQPVGVMDGFSFILSTADRAETLPSSDVPLVDGVSSFALLGRGRGP